MKIPTFLVGLSRLSIRPNFEWSSHHILIYIKSSFIIHELVHEHNKVEFKEILD